MNAVMASEDILSIPRQEGVIWVTKACDLGFKARLELWQSTVGLEFQRNDHWVSMMVDDQIIATHWCPRWFLDEPVKFKSRFLLQNHLTGLLLELLSPSPSRNQKSSALTNHRISARQMQSPNFKSQVLCSWRPWISEISPPLPSPGALGETWEWQMQCCLPDLQSKNCTSKVRTDTRNFSLKSDFPSRLSWAPESQGL